jgi:hypothetical protein
MRSFFKHPDLDKFYKIFEKEERSPIFSGKFDLFYYCFLIGISAGKRSGWNKDESSDALELAKRFPNNMKDSKLLILNLLLTGYTIEKKKKVEVDTFANSILARLIDHDDINQLSEEGYKRINSFAYAGFEILYNEEKYKYPTNGSEAIVRIKDILDKNFSKKPWV